MQGRIWIVIGVLIALTLESCGVSFMRKPGEGELVMTAAPSGKALVNFHFPSRMGSGNYQVFDREKFIGNLIPGYRFQYACDPGEHVFIGSAQSASAIQAKLAADKVYDVVINAFFGGFFKANIKMEPITKAHAKRAELANWEGRERLVIFTGDEGAMRLQQKRQKWAQKTLVDFLEGSHKKRLQTLSTGDHR